MLMLIEPVVVHASFALPVRHTDSSANNVCRVQKVDFSSRDSASKVTVAVSATITGGFIGNKSAVFLVAIVITIAININGLYKHAQRRTSIEWLFFLLQTIGRQTSTADCDLL